MPLVYNTSTAANSTSSGTPSTEVDLVSIKPGARNVKLREIDLQGMGASLNLVSGLALEVIEWGTASTGGAGLTPAANDPGYQAATATVLSLPTSGTTRTNRQITGCPTTGRGQWIARDQDAPIELPGSSAASIDFMDISALASFLFRYSFEHQE
jgi:hypothetical protein